MNKYQLKDICRTYGLPVSGNKPDLLQRIIPFLQALNTIDDDNNDVIDGAE